MHRGACHGEPHVPYAASRLVAVTGLIARAEALAGGLAPPDDVKRLVARGVWVRLTGDGFVPPRALGARSTNRRRPASLLILASPSITRAAARRQPFVGCRGARPTVPAGRRRPGPRHEVGGPGRGCATASSTTMRGSIPAEVLTVRGCRCSDLARTALDIAREEGFAAGVVRDRCGSHSAECRCPSSRARSAPMRHWPHVSVAAKRSPSPTRSGVDRASPSRASWSMRQGSGADPDPVRAPRRDGLRRGATSGSVVTCSSSTGWLKCRPPDRGGVAATAADRRS